MPKEYDVEDEGERYEKCHCPIFAKEVRIR
jgi:hypothetical protein